jgi:hypothetical protein
MKYSLLIIMLAAAFSLKAQQVIITTPVIDGPLIKTDNLWNITVVSNEQVPFSGRVQLTVTDQSGRTVLSAVSNMFLFTRGAKVLNYAMVSPIAFNYNAIGSKGSYIKAGNYNVCYNIIQEKGREQLPVGEECIEINIEPFSVPLLVFPAENDTIYENHPVFSWVAPAPLQMFNSLKYEVRVVEILDGQGSQEALENNTPVYIEKNLVATVRNLPNSSKGLTEEKDYAWQVFAYDGSSVIKSESWKFRVVKDSVREIVENSPFIDLKNSNPEFGLMHQGFIKILLKNYTVDTVGILGIVEESTGKKIANAEVKLRSGENYILKEIDRKIRLDETKVYHLVWLNSRNEKWMVRYRPKYYR